MNQSFTKPTNNKIESVFAKRYIFNLDDLSLPKNIRNQIHLYIKKLDLFGLSKSIKQHLYQQQQISILQSYLEKEQCKGLFIALRFANLLKTWSTLRSPSLVIIVQSEKQFSGIIDLLYQIFHKLGFKRNKVFYCDEKSNSFSVYQQLTSQKYSILGCTLNKFYNLLMTKVVSPLMIKSIIFYNFLNCEIQSQQQIFLSQLLQITSPCTYITIFPASKEDFEAAQNLFIIKKQKLLLNTLTKLSSDIGADQKKHFQTVPKSVDQEKHPPREFEEVQDYLRNWIKVYELIPITAQIYNVMQVDKLDIAMNSNAVKIIILTESEFNAAKMEEFLNQLLKKSTIENKVFNQYRKKVSIEKQKKYLNKKSIYIGNQYQIQLLIEKKIIQILLIRYFFIDNYMMLEEKAEINFLIQILKAKGTQIIINKD
eukprot:TRINITY_DN11385_c0_g1_i2.p1 TRINITY_DN11385_c0_g1~~TRINITY_DN11385_c0_g1_i2.p1  ORF type:complete len:425 (-),score=65.78 TRINITY_DN11385_c0_g1_i2:214-1488(-)